MSYSFLLISGQANPNVTIPVGPANNGQTAVLNRKGATLTSTGTVSNGRAVFNIPADRVAEFSGRYTVTVGANEVQRGDIDLVITPATGGGSGNTDLTNYPTKSEVSSQLAGAVSAKADKTYVDTQLATKAATADLAAKLDASAVKTVATTGVYSDLTGKPDLSVLATTAALTSGLSGKANAADVYNKAQVDSAVATKAAAADVYTKSAADAKFALIGQGGGGASNVLVLGPSDPVPANTAAGTIIVRKAS